MMGRRRDDVAVFWDARPLPPRILVGLWRLGSGIDRTPHSFAIKSPAQIVGILIALRDSGVTIRHAQFWGHGYAKGPVVGRMRHPHPALEGRLVPEHHFTDDDLEAIGDAAPDLLTWWWRCCRIGSSYEFPLRFQRAMPGVVTAQHCVTISGTQEVQRGPLKGLRIPQPWRQGGGCALRPNEDPWWPIDGRGLAGCGVTKMTIPRSFYRPL